MGGIADFSSGAALCPDGKSIVVVESVTKTENIPRLCRPSHRERRYL